MIRTITLNNMKTRVVIANLFLLVQVNILEVDAQEQWKTCIGHYHHAIEILGRLGWWHNHRVSVVHWPMVLLLVPYRWWPRRHYQLYPPSSDGPYRGLSIRMAESLCPLITRLGKFEYLSQTILFPPYSHLVEVASARKIEQKHLFDGCFVDLFGRQEYLGRKLLPGLRLPRSAWLQ